MPYLTEPGASFQEIVAELYARGYDHLDQDAAGQLRAKRIVNQAYLELVEEENWPFRRDTATGASPLAIVNIGDIIGVEDSNDLPLTPISAEQWAEYSNDQLAALAVYHRDGNTVWVYPEGQTITVIYFATAPYLVADVDTTWVPLRYMDVIVDGAVRRAAKDRDNRDAAQFAEEERQRGLAVMRRKLLTPATNMWLHGGSLDD